MRSGRLFLYGGRNSLEQNMHLCLSFFPALVAVAMTLGERGERGLETAAEGPDSSISSGGCSSKPEWYPFFYHALRQRTNV